MAGAFFSETRYTECMADSASEYSPQNNRPNPEELAASVKEQDFQNVSKEIDASFNRIEKMTAEDVPASFVELEIQNAKFRNEFRESDKQEDEHLTAESLLSKYVMTAKRECIQRLADRCLHLPNGPSAVFTALLDRMTGSVHQEEYQYLHDVAQAVVEHLESWEKESFEDVEDYFSLSSFRQTLAELKKIQKSIQDRNLFKSISGAIPSSKVREEIIQDVFNEAVTANKAFSAVFESEDPKRAFAGFVAEARAELGEDADEQLILMFSEKMRVFEGEFILQLREVAYSQDILPNERLQLKDEILDLIHFLYDYTIEDDHTVEGDHIFFGDESLGRIMEVVERLFGSKQNLESVGS
jgi:hypothetical protein